MNTLHKLITILSLAALLSGSLPVQATPAAAPVANDDSGPGFITDEDTAFVTADVLANDTDPEGDPLSIAGFDTSATIGLVTYTPPLPAEALDTTFDGDGKVTTDFFGAPDYGHALALQPDGKLIIAGYTYNGGIADFALARYNPDGSLDTSFDGDGRVTTDFFNETDSAYALVIQPDGKLVAAGLADNGGNWDFALARYNPDGSLDTSFDGDGKLTTDFFLETDAAYALALQPDGKLVAAGITLYTVSSFALARYNPDGSLDSSFDGDGRVITDLFGTGDSASALVVQADGKLIAAGDSGNNFALVRYNPDGSLDTSFDGDGRVTTDFFGYSDEADALALRPDGKLVAAGYAYTGNDRDFALACYNPDGSLDASFDGDGKATTDFFGGWDQGRALVLQPDGKLLAAGWAENGYYSDFALARYNTNGSLDASFGGDGKITTDFFGIYDSAYALALQPDGKLVAAGKAENGSGDPDFALARYSAEEGVFTYSPNGQFEWLAAGEVTTDTFTYVVSDGALTDTATVSITINGLGETPIANDDSGPGFTTDEDTPFTLADVLANDSDLDGDPLSVEGFDASGTIGLVTYMPPDPAGTLDPTFDGDGKVTTDFFTNYDHSYALVVQPDGKLIVAGASSGDFALARYNLDGSLDLSFDGDGLLITDFDGNSDEAHALALQPDGKLVVAGYTHNGSIADFALARYNPDGSLDTTFDGDGLLTTDFAGSNDQAHTLILQPDGKIVVAGHTFSANLRDFALARYNPDGSLDITFDGDGKLTTDFFGGDDIIGAVILLPDGKLITAGCAWNGDNDDFALARYNPDGSLDTTFDGDGLLTTDFFWGYDYASSAVLQPDGKLVVVGVSMVGYSDFALARYNPDGSLDTTFDGDGLLITDFFGHNDAICTLVLQLDGKIIVAGDAWYDSTGDFALARYNPDGSLDPSFDGDGLLTTDFFGGYDTAYGLALQPDGKLVVAGDAQNGSTYDFALARYTATGSGSFLYDPNDQFEWLADGEVATDTFTYVVSDGALTDTATVSITINGLNDAPLLDPIGNQSVDELGILAFTVTASDPEQDALAFSLDPGAPQGAALTPGGAFTWTPSEAQGPGVYTLTVRVSDDGSPALDDFETLTITVGELNLAPIAAADTYATIEDTILSVTAPGLLANDSDADIPAQALAAVLDTPPALGELALAADGSFVYTPTPNFNGTLTFTYYANDGVENSLPTLVSISVGPVNDVPMANAGADQAADEGEPVSFSGVYIDPGLLSIQAVEITWNFGDGASVTGTLTPTHAYADDGIYTVTLMVDDGDGGTGVDTLLVTVANVAPTLDPIAGQSVVAGQPLTLTAAYADPGALDTHTAVIDWGDGFTETLDLAAGLTSFDLAHAYAAAGAYTVTLTLTDDDGGLDTLTFLVTVEPAGYIILLPVITK